LKKKITKKTYQLQKKSYGDEDAQKLQEIKILRPNICEIFAEIRNSHQILINHIKQRHDHNPSVVVLGCRVCAAVAQCVWVRDMSVRTAGGPIPAP